MNLYLSTNMYKGAEFDRTIPWIEKFGGRLGIEVFPMFHEAEFEPLLRDAMEKLQTVPVTFHEPYYLTDHTAYPGTETYEKTWGFIRQTIPYMTALSAKYMVFHHNNREIAAENRTELLTEARGQYLEAAKLCSGNGILLAVENAGVGSRAIFNEEEFIKECRMSSCPVLIDIGHAWANGWDLERVIRQLSVQIVSFHLHNNDGIHDSHRRIHDGTLDFAKFIDWYKKYTPTADLVLEYSPAVAGDEVGIEADIREVLGYF